MARAIGWVSVRIGGNCRRFGRGCTLGVAGSRSRDAKLGGLDRWYSGRTHCGGYLPLEIEITESFLRSGPHWLELRLDNRNDPEIPPSKSLDELDFCRYGGLCTYVRLRLAPPVHVTQAI
jgi:hypothetical protein